MYRRNFFKSNGLRLSYVDFGGNSEKILLVLHGHFGTASQFSFLARNLDGWRVMGLDQRGHGWSEHAKKLDYSRKSYIDDIYNFIQHELGGKPVVLLGHSLGGINAYQFAARYRDLVKALIIEDIGTECNDDLSYARSFPERTPTIKEMKQVFDEYFGTGAFPYFAESLVQYEDGWGFRFHIEGLIRSQQLLNGIWWEDWTSSTCPALLLHGEKSSILSHGLAQEMIARRPNTKLVQFPGCGHTVHDQDPDGFILAVRNFLNGTML
jgi:esterase